MGKLELDLPVQWRRRTEALTAIMVNARAFCKWFSGTSKIERNENQAGELCMKLGMGLPGCAPNPIYCTPTRANELFQLIDITPLPTATRAAWEYHKFCVRVLHLLRFSFYSCALSSTGEGIGAGSPRRCSLGKLVHSKNLEQNQKKVKDQEGAKK